MMDNPQSDRSDSGRFAPAQKLTLSDEEFGTIRTLVYDRFGINLTEQKRALVLGRLQKVLRERSFSTFREYCDFLRDDRSGQALLEFVNRITTNHTFFFREVDHFHFLRETALPAIVERKGSDRDLRIWSAGCSSGEEPYTIAMVLLEFFGPAYHRWDGGVLATDISQKVLDLAREGVYPEERLQNVPAGLREKYFVGDGPDRWRVRDALKREITFRRFNFKTPEFPFKKKFDIIFCRNVMIYFDAPTREALVGKFFRYTAPGGYLFIGHSESLRRETTPYRYIRPATYQRPLES